MASYEAVPCPHCRGLGQWQDTGVCLTCQGVGVAVRPDLHLLAEIEDGQRTAERLRRELAEAQAEAKAANDDAIYYRGRVASLREEQGNVVGRLCNALGEWYEREKSEDWNDRLTRGDAAEVVDAICEVLSEGDWQHVRLYTVTLNLSVTATVSDVEAGNADEAEELAREQIEAFSACRGNVSFSLDDMELADVE